MDYYLRRREMRRTTLIDFYIVVWTFERITREFTQTSWRAWRQRIDDKLFVSFVERFLRGSLYLTLVDSRLIIARPYLSRVT